MPDMRPEQKRELLAQLLRDKLARDKLARQATAQLIAAGIPEEHIQTESFFNQERKAKPAQPAA